MSDKKDDEVFDKVSAHGTKINLENTDLDVGHKTRPDGVAEHFTSQKRPDGTKAFYKGEATYPSNYKDRMAQAIATQDMFHNIADSVAYNDLPSYIQEANVKKNKLIEKDAKNAYNRLVEMNKPEKITYDEEGGYKAEYVRGHTIRHTQTTETKTPSGKPSYLTKVIVEVPTPDGLRQYYGEGISSRPGTSRSKAQLIASDRYFTNPSDSINTQMYTPDNVFDGLIKKDNVSLWDNPRLRAIEEIKNDK